MDFSTYGDMPPMTESNQQPLGDPGKRHGWRCCSSFNSVLSNIVNQDTSRDALTTNITNWLRTLPDKGQGGKSQFKLNFIFLGTSSEEFFASMNKASVASKKPATSTERPKTPEGESPFDFWFYIFFTYLFTYLYHLLPFYAQFIYQTFDCNCIWL